MQKGDLDIMKNLKKEIEDLIFLKTVDLQKIKQPLHRKKDNQLKS